MNELPDATPTIERSWALIAGYVDGIDDYVSSRLLALLREAHMDVVRTDINLTVPRPTPDEDGVYDVAFYDNEIRAVRPSPVPGLVLIDSRDGRRALGVLYAERLGAALIAAAQDARRIAAEAAQEEP